MKIDVKKILCKSIMALMVIPFFLVNSIPVLADYSVSTYYIDPSSVTAYVYWNSVGYNYTYLQNQNTTISIPNIRTNTGNTNDRLICNASGSSYSCYYLGSSGNVGTFQFETTIAHDEIESNTVLRGAEIPWLTGSYIHDTGYVNAHSFQVSSDQSFIMAFISSKNLWASGIAHDNSWFTVYKNNNNSITSRLLTSAEINAGAYQYVFSLKASSGTSLVNVNFPAIDSNTRIIPIFMGKEAFMSDDLKQSLGMSTDTEVALNNISSKIDSILILNDTQTKAAVATNNNLISGNPTSQAAQSALNNSNTNLNNRVNQMNSIETEYNSDLNAALDDIDLSTDLVQHTGFTNAALWVSAQFNRLVIGTPLELVITFSLITGLALVLIGKVRG